MPASWRTHPQLERRSSSEAAPSEYVPFSSPSSPLRILRNLQPSRLRTRPARAGMPTTRSPPTPCLVALKATVGHLREENT
eukprot:scaffold68588_cov47-Phaeocystis_antarctica.AAC.1